MFKYFKQTIIRRKTIKITAFDHEILPLCLLSTEEDQLQ